MKKLDELLDHNYDGIQEYDNDLPRWWVQLFWLTIVWGIGYAIWFHYPSTPTPEERLASGMREIEQLRAAKQSVSAGPESEAELLKLAADAGILKQGAEIYAAKCLACHAQGGAGLVGPNLTDDYYIHGGKISDIKQIVMEGVLDKGMLAWKTLLTKAEINAVVAYVWSLHGTNPPNPKAPQGEVVARQ